MGLLPTGYPQGSPEGMTLAGMTGRPPPTVTTGAPGGAHATANSGGPPLAGITRSPGLVQPALLSSAEHAARGELGVQWSSARLVGASPIPARDSQASVITLALCAWSELPPIDEILPTLQLVQLPFVVGGQYRLADARRR